MRGEGKLQKEIREKNLKDVLFSIKLANSNKKFCTIQYIHWWTKLNRESIMNHLETLIESGQIIEYKVYNNARGFVTTSIDKKIRLNKKILLEFDENTELQIYKLKYPDIKIGVRSKYLRSGKSTISSP